MLKRTGTLLLTAAMTLSLSTASLFADTEVAEEPEVEEAVSTEYMITAASSDKKTDSVNISESLAAITLTVKQTLGIGDEYTDFYGNLDDYGSYKLWSLNWSSDSGSLNVTADEDGKIMYMNRYSDSTSDYYYSDSFSPKFQKVLREDAEKVAIRYLNRVLSDNETFELSNYLEKLSTSATDSYMFSGTIKVNSLITPITFTVRVSTADMEVSMFRRSDRYSEYRYGFPEISDVTGTDLAFRQLASKIDMDIQYYLTYDEDDNTLSNPIAKLRYTPVSTGNWFVDATDSELINKDDLYADLVAGNDNKYNATPSVAEAPVEEEVSMDTAADAGGATLTDTELSGIEKLKDVLSQEKLDEAVKKYTEFGLDKYELSTVSYSKRTMTIYEGGVETEEDKIYASMYYTMRVTDPSIIGMTQEGYKALTDNGNVYYIRKYVTADAKTGEVISLYTNYPYFDYEYRIPVAADDSTLKAAEAFLEKYYGDYFTETELSNTYDSQYSLSASYSYTRVHNGYKLSANSVSASVGKLSGDIDDYSISWTDNVVFEDSTNIISKEKACEVYSEAFEAALCYIEVPVAIDPKDPEMSFYYNNGYSCVYRYINAYILDQTVDAYGVSAVTGELLTYEAGKDVQMIMTYTDLDGNINREKLEKLAEYGVTYSNNAERKAEFGGEMLLSQKDCLVLLLNAVGYSFDADTIEGKTLDWLYSSAYSYGFITADEKDPEKLLTNEEVMRMIISATSYAKAAKLEGIYKCSFTDEKDISDDCYSYVAIASATGLTGDGESFMPKSIMTREGLALAIYGFMAD